MPSPYFIAPFMKYLTKSLTDLDLKETVREEKNKDFILGNNI